MVQPCRDYASEKGLGKGEGADLLGIRCRGHLAPCNAIRRCPSEQFYSACISAHRKWVADEVEMKVARPTSRGAATKSSSSGFDDFEASCMIRFTAVDLRFTFGR